jgi:hypothetical protein
MNWSSLANRERNEKEAELSRVMEERKKLHDRLETQRENRSVRLEREREIQQKLELQVRFTVLFIAIDLSLIILLTHRKPNVRRQKHVDWQPNVNNNRNHYSNIIVNKMKKRHVIVKWNMNE